MSEDPLDDLGSVDARDDAQRAATHTTVFDVDVQDALEALHPAHGGRRRMGFAGGWMSPVGDDVVAVFEVRGEHAVVSGGMGAGAWHRASSLRERHFRGGEAGDAKSAGLPICTAGGCPEGVRHTDVPHEFHRGEHDMSRAGMEGESRELSDAGVVGQRVGRDGAQSQGLAPGVGADGDAVVHGAAEDSPAQRVVPVRSGQGVKFG